jgi:hypothetical protein
MTLDPTNRERATAVIERRKRFDQGGAYSKMLARGEVYAKVADIDVETWRAAIRRQARVDKIHVATGITNDGTTAWAFIDRAHSEEEHAAEDKWFRLASEAHHTATRLGHDWALARDGAEGAVACKRCRALGYLNADEGLADGEIFEDACEAEDGADG